MTPVPRSPVEATRTGGTDGPAIECGSGDRNSHLTPERSDGTDTVRRGATEAATSRRIDANPPGEPAPVPAPVGPRTGASSDACWVDVVEVERLTPGRGVAALVGSRQVAIFLVAEGEVYAVDNHDPFSGAQVMSRGIVGDRAGVPKVASPMYKQSFDLRTGQCLDDDSVRLTTYPVRVVGGRVEVAVP